MKIIQISSIVTCFLVVFMTLVASYILLAFDKKRKEKIMNRKEKKIKIVDNTHVRYF